MPERPASPIASGAEPRETELAGRIAGRLAGRPVRALPDLPGARRAAVLLVLRPAAPTPLDALEAESLFVRRAETPSDPWSGHIALPGGRADPSDRDLVDTAVRETREETSLELRRSDLLGQLDDIRPFSAHLPPIVVTPFVAWLSGEMTVRESPELTGHVWIPLAALLDPARRTQHRLAGPPERLFPAIAHGQAVIWGLTFRIVEDFLQRIRGTVG